MNKIEFNKHMSDEFGIYIENIPSLPTLTKEYETTDIAGRNGSLTKFKGYKDLEIELSCHFRCDDNYEYIDRKNQITAWLYNYKNNNKLKFSFYDNCYWKVKQVELSNFTTKVKVMRCFTIKFIVEPFCYSNNKEITLTKATSIRNLGTIETRPKIIIYTDIRDKENGETITLFINNQTVVLKKITEDNITIDSELMNCYTTNESGVMINTNQKMYTNFPIMDIGNNNISWVGNVSKIVIDGRWCN